LGGDIRKGGRSLLAEQCGVLLFLQVVRRTRCYAFLDSAVFNLI